MLKILRGNRGVFSQDERTSITNSIPAAIPTPEQRQEVQKCVLNWLVAWVRLFQLTKNTKNVGGAERLLGCYVASERMEDLTGVWNTTSSLGGPTPHMNSSRLEREMSNIAANSRQPTNPAITSVVGEDELAEEHWPVRRTLERIIRDAQEGFRNGESASHNARQVTTESNITFNDAWQGTELFPMPLTIRVCH